LLIEATMVNPYESPQTKSDQAEPTLQARPTWSHYFTHITVNGCNILGLVNLLAFIGAFVAIIAVAPPVENRTVGMLLMALAVCVCSGFDLAIRQATVREGRWRRLLSPHAGGALVFIPLWAIYPAFALVVLGIVLYRALIAPA
jgi:hypothetical protein